MATSEKTLDTGQKYHRIEATSGWRSLKLAELWHYRELVWFWTFRDIKGRYRQMALGPLWIIIQPIMNTIVFSIIFGNLAQLPSDDLPYPLFTYSGLIIWGLFTSVANQAVGSLTSNMNVISKVYFPRLLLPVKGAASAVVDLGVGLIVLFILMLIYQYPPSPRIVYLPFFVLLAIITGLAIGFWSAAIAVRFRDFRKVISYGLNFALYATPVAYAASAIPERFVTLYKLNPMYWVVDGFRWAVIGNGNGPELMMIIPICIVLVVFFSGAFVFRSAERTIVDWL